MPSIVLNNNIEKFLRRYLLEQGYLLLNNLKSSGETGVDILAKKGFETYFIEVIGYKSSPPARSRDFYEVFFRVISRIKDGANNCIMALPINFKDGLSRRANQYGCAWERIAKAFPEIKIWLVDIANNRVEETDWNQWLG